MANQPQPFKTHHVTRALKAALAAGVQNPSCTVRLPGGATITIDSGKPDAAVIPKPGKAPSSRSSRTSVGGRK